MNDDELLRYSRQILLAEIDVAGQERLLGARVLIVGLGGLGSAAAMYLAAAGVGTLVLADPDRVELSNLQRQILHTSADIGRAKTDSARDRLNALNPGTRLELHRERLSGSVLNALVARADVVIDATDNFPSRFEINAACVAARVALVTGAALRFEGQIGVFGPHLGADVPCYRCVFDDVDDEPETCSRAGVLAPLLGVIGSMQAVEAAKFVVGAGCGLAGRILHFNALGGAWRESVVHRDPGCPQCGARAGAAGSVAPSKTDAA